MPIGCSRCGNKKMTLLAFITDTFAVETHWAWPTSSTTSHLVVIDNWFTELRQKLAR